MTLFPWGILKKKKKKHTSEPIYKTEIESQDVEKVGGRTGINQETDPDIYTILCINN